MTSARIHALRLAAMILFLALAGSALGQNAPAGNAHPDTTLLRSTTLANPLAPPPGWADPMTPEEKHAFSRSVDLSPLRDAPVSHDGRIKILDTMAREMARALTGRSRYQDALPVYNDQGRIVRVRTLSYDPLFTMLDLFASPSYYDDKPIIHVEYLPARRALLEAALDAPNEIERWMTLTRLSPEILSEGFPIVANQTLIDPEISAALNRLSSLAEILHQGHNNLLMLAPAREGGRWRHVSDLNAETPLLQAFRALGDAWRAGDAERVSELAREARAELDAINDGRDAPLQRRAELFYNVLNPFELGAWLYLISFIALILAFGAEWRTLIAIGLVALIAAMIAHTAGFGARWFIAQRLPIQNQFESMTGLALGGAAAGLAIMLFRRQWLFGAAGAGVGFLVLLAATQTGIPGADIGREAAILNTSWLLKYHVSTVLISYGLITLAAIISAFYLFVHYANKRRAAATDDTAVSFAAQSLNLDGTVNAGRSRLLADLDNAQMIVLQLAFWTLAVGILLGAWWADHSWGRWWAFDPKETWALLTWLVYLIVIHVRVALPKGRALATAWLSIAGFVVMLWTYFGVNLLLPGLHAYA